MINCKSHFATATHLAVREHEEEEDEKINPISHMALKVIRPQKPQKAAPKRSYVDHYYSTDHCYTKVTTTHLK